MIILILNGCVSFVKNNQEFDLSQEWYSKDIFKSCVHSLSRAHVHKTAYIYNTSLWSRLFLRSSSSTALQICDHYRLGIFIELKLYTAATNYA